MRIKKFPYEFFNEQDIVPSSQFTFKHCSINEAHYVRELLVHEYDVNVVVQAMNFIALIDNRVIGLAGVNRAMGPAVEIIQMRLCWFLR